MSSSKQGKAASKNKLSKIAEDKAHSSEATPKKRRSGRMETMTGQSKPGSDREPDKLKYRISPEESDRRFKERGGATTATFVKYGPDGKRPTLTIIYDLPRGEEHGEGSENSFSPKPTKDFPHVTTNR